MAHSWTLADMPAQQGKRFLITGANSGIGYAAALELARHGAVVLLACRDRARGTEALTRLRREALGPNTAASQAELIELDLASLADVRRVGAELVDRGQALDGLINNAGVMAPPKRRETRDGFELQFGTNVLGHFALTCGLMPLLKVSGSATLEGRARVVTVLSIAHGRGARLNFDDLQSLQSYSPRGAYGQSKLANLMFAFELERKLREEGAGVISVAVHPGVAKTNIFRIGNGKGMARLAEKAISGAIGLLLGSDADGELPTLFGATADEAEGGSYYGPQGLAEARGGDVGKAKIAAPARDNAAQRRLWEVCEQLTGCSC